jgi:hypothetical protein
MWESRRLTTLWASMACYRDSFTFTFTFTLPHLTSPQVLALLPFLSTVTVRLHKFLQNEASPHSNKKHRVKVYMQRSQDGAVGIVTCCGLDGWGLEFEFRWGQDFVPLHIVPNRFWDLLSLLSNGYRAFFPRGVKLTTHLHLVSRSRIH